MKILLWHVHGSWANAFVQGGHDYVLPVLPGRPADGLGRARTWDWPANVVERTPAQLADEDIDVVLLQRPHEAGLVEQWCGRTPGRDIPAVYLEHNAPEPHPVDSRHPMADSGMPIVHVTHFNELYWDCAGAATQVIEHGIVDPGTRYDGALPHCALVVNEPQRRGRMVGTDLLGRFTDLAPVDWFGMGAAELPGARRMGDLPQDRMLTELARRRVYLHLTRWTSLGLSLLEAMHLGMPVVAVSSTEIHEAVPPGAGVVSTDVERLRAAARQYLNDPDAAQAAGAAAREHARDRYGLERFLGDWDRLMKEVIR